MAKEIVVYSKERCPQCTAVKRWLTGANLDYEEKDATEENNKKYVETLGYTQLPVTVIYENDILMDKWYGFDVEKLNGLLKTD